MIVETSLHGAPNADETVLLSVLEDRPLLQMCELEEKDNAECRSDVECLCPLLRETRKTSPPTLPGLSLFVLIQQMSSDLLTAEEARIKTLC